MWPLRKLAFHPFSTAVPFWGQTTWSLSGSSPQRDCSARRVNVGTPRLAQLKGLSLQFFAQSQFGVRHGARDLSEQASMSKASEDQSSARSMARTAWWTSRARVSHTALARPQPHFDFHGQPRGRFLQEQCRRRNILDANVNHFGSSAPFGGQRVLGI